MNRNLLSLHDRALFLPVSAVLVCVMLACSRSVVKTDGGEGEAPSGAIAPTSSEAKDSSALHQKSAGAYQQGPPQAKPGDRAAGGTEEAPQTIEDLPWPSRLGVKIAALRAKVPTVDRVVLVPDEATFLEAMSQWSLEARWPILIEDDVYAPMFIRKFHPAQIIRMKKSAVPLATAADLPRRISRILCSSWRSAKSAQDLSGVTDPKAVWKTDGWTTPGVVLTSLQDHAWPAALALAADRGEPIAYVEGNYGPVAGSLNGSAFAKLSGAVEDAVKSTGYSYITLGDDIDTVTLVRDVPGKYFPEEQAPNNSRLATTDGLARTGHDQRWAIVGWIFGSPQRSVYQAMCSIFLTPDSALLFDSYPSAPGWSDYALTHVQERLSQMGLKRIDLYQQPQAGPGVWEKLAPNGLDRDVIFINTKGMMYWFDLGSGRVSVNDIPILNVPAAVHFIHSYSSVAPDDDRQLAGRWLERGVFAWVGSVNEPGLQGFVEPSMIADRIAAACPFLVAARYLTGFKAWKITLIGDPLYTILKPAPRMMPDAAPSVTGEDLHDILRTQSEEAESKSGAWASALHTMDLLGLDNLAVTVFQRKLASGADNSSGGGEVKISKGDRVDALQAALGALFRAGTPAEFVDAFANIPRDRLTGAQRDMLWHKLMPAILTRDPKQLPSGALDLLAENLRGPEKYFDAARVAYLLEQAGNTAQANAILDEAQAQTKDGYALNVIRAARPH